jgi:hypothetical protein
METGIVTRQRAGQRKSRGSIHNSGKSFLSNPKGSNSTLGPPTFLLSGYQRLSFRKNGAQKLKHCSPMLRMSGATPPLSIYSHKEQTNTITFLFNFLSIYIILHYASIFKERGMYFQTLHSLHSFRVHN